ncbi:hypothetical protein PSPO01_11803 [Paraphaeosphaeria sporulosa]
MNVCSICKIGRDDTTICIVEGGPWENRRAVRKKSWEDLSEAPIFQPTRVNQAKQPETSGFAMLHKNATGSRRQTSGGFSPRCASNIATPTTPDSCLEQSAREKGRCRHSYAPSDRVWSSDTTCGRQRTNQSIRNLQRKIADNSSQMRVAAGPGARTNRDRARSQGNRQVMIAVDPGRDGSPFG